MMRRPTLMRAVSNGRGLFLAAGAILGVGIYGFVATFQPYASGRVLEPLRSLDRPLVATLPSPLEVLPAPVESSAVPESGIEPAPQEPSAAFVRAAPSPAPSPSVAPGPVEAAGGDGGVTPLAPPPQPDETPAATGPVLVDAPALPTIDASRPEPRSPDAPATPANTTLPATPTPNISKDDDPRERSGPAKPGKADNGNGAAKGQGKGQSQGKANGQSK